MKKLTLFVFGVAFSALSSNAQWVQTSGPNNVIINCMAADSAGIFAGTDAGVYFKH